MKNILVVSLGGSPAVVTETLWALERREDDPFWPDRLVIVTTSGARRLDALAETGGGAATPGSKLRELAAELGRPLFDLEEIVARRPDGGAVEDIRDEADAIAEVARQATLDDAATPHLSSAGGWVRQTKDRVDQSSAGGRRAKFYEAVGAAARKNRIAEPLRLDPAAGDA